MKDRWQKEDVTVFGYSMPQQVVPESEPWAPCYYMLDENGAVRTCSDGQEWSAWIERSAALRHVAFYEGPDGVGVSTTFVGIDLAMGEYVHPSLWETMVRGGPLDGKTRRYWTRVDAVRGHVEVVQEVRAASVAHASLDELKRQVFARIPFERAITLKEE